VYFCLDGEMTVFRRWQITRHLSRCAPCQNGYDFELELRQIVAKRCHEQMPTDLKQRITEALGLFESDGELDK
jgi:mycothiol system anti-sigma-R factor